MYRGGGVLADLKWRSGPLSMKEEGEGMYSQISDLSPCKKIKGAIDKRHDETCQHE